MRRKKYSCPNGCKLPPRNKTIIEIDDGTYIFDYNDYNFCPVCCNLMPESSQKLEGFFDLFNLHPSLKPSLRLLYKSEFVSAAREAFVILEEYLRKKSGLDLHGSDLAVSALSFKYNSKTDIIEKKPLISINDLSTESKRNEQNGLRFLLMGFFTGQRNLYLHNSIGSGFSNAVSVLIETSFILHLLDGHSVTDYGKWIPIKTDGASTDLDYIYRNMPKKTDRRKLKKSISKRNK